MAFWKKLEDFNGNYEGFLEKLHENHLNLPIDPNYSTLFEILSIILKKWNGDITIERKIYLGF
jgi:hypothetical protein